jgi:hypothetical protein
VALQVVETWPGVVGTYGRDEIIPPAAVEQSVVIKVSDDDPYGGWPSESVQVDEVVDEDLQGVIAPAGRSEVYVVVRVSIAKDVACESVELVMGKGVKAEFPAEVDIPFALDTSDQEVDASGEFTDTKVVFCHVEAVEVIAALDKREVLGSPKVVVRNKVVVLV